MILTRLPELERISLLSHRLVMLRSRLWPDLRVRSQVYKLWDIQITHTDIALNTWREEITSWKRLALTWLQTCLRWGQHIRSGSGTGTIFGLGGGAQLTICLVGSVKWICSYMIYYLHYALLLPLPNQSVCLNETTLFVFSFGVTRNKTKKHNYLSKEDMQWNFVKTLLTRFMTWISWQALN